MSWRRRPPAAPAIAHLLQHLLQHLPPHLPPPLPPNLLSTLRPALLARLPPWPGAWLFARMLNATLARQLPADTRSALEGKRLRLRVSDAGLTFDVCWRADGFTPLAGGAPADLAIAASLRDLWRLARREEDPDSLFFRRRLVLEGDTELGLIFKNALDAFDLGALELFLRRVEQLAAPGK
jgi:predicted lipid carrier protein YhbT